MEVGFKGNAKYTVCHLTAYHNTTGEKQSVAKWKAAFKPTPQFSSSSSLCHLQHEQLCVYCRMCDGPLQVQGSLPPSVDSLSQHTANSKFLAFLPQSWQLLHPHNLNSPPPAVKHSGFMSGMLDYCAHLAWTQASGAWSIHCSTWVKVMESSLSLLRSPMSKHMVTEHLEHVWVTRTT